MLRQNGTRTKGTKQVAPPAPHAFGRPRLLSVPRAAWLLGFFLLSCFLLTPPAAQAQNGGHGGGFRAPRMQAPRAPRNQMQRNQMQRNQVQRNQIQRNPVQQNPAQRNEAAGNPAQQSQATHPAAPQGQPQGQQQPAFRAPQSNFASPNIPAGTAPRAGSGTFAGGPSTEGPRNQYAVPPARTGNQQHLGGWLQNHQGQSFTNQENSLRQEPGFNRLPAQQQQRLFNQLHRLDAMPQQQRQRTLGRIENMERLSPEARQQVRNSAQELSSMDPGRKQQVRGAFRQLRDLPPAQRQQELNSPAFRSQYSDHERQVLGNLLSVEP